MHNSTAPYCLDPACWCHHDAVYHGGITTTLLDRQPTQEELAMALSILSVNTTVKLTDEVPFELNLTV